MAPRGLSSLSGRQDGNVDGTLPMAMWGVALITLSVLVSITAALAVAKRVISQRRDESNPRATVLDVGEWDESWDLAPSTPPSASSEWRQH
jgi:hypothetical protein